MPGKEVSLKRRIFERCRVGELLALCDGATKQDPKRLKQLIKAKELFFKKAEALGCGVVEILFTSSKQQKGVS